MARGSFSFIVLLICTCGFGLSYIFIRPFWDIIMFNCVSLVPQHSDIYAVFQLFFDYLPLIFFVGGMLIWIIIQSMDEY